jgi:hypothetical protein
MKTSETKKFVKIFCEAFLIKKKYFASTKTYFHVYKQGFLYSQAVRIRVNGKNVKGTFCPFKQIIFLTWTKNIFDAGVQYNFNC